MFRRHILGREPMDFSGLLAHAGLLLRPARADRAWLGTTTLNYTAQGITLTGPALRGSPLYRAGIDRGDRLVKAGRRELKTQRDLRDLLDSAKPGERVTLTVEGRTGRREVEIEWAPAPDLEIVRYEDAGRTPAPEERAFREAWLASKLPTMGSGN
jgi:predicted metalloprotease with PDZ domain